MREAEMAERGVKRDQRDPEVLTLTQAALLVGVSDDRLKAEVRAGRLAGRRLGRTWRFTRAALMAWLEARGGDDA
jgi:excisionase family DNA binding protein